ncbi:MAG: hypothetical protein JW741_19385 [Sedimentisphaerales bacterium]|nr:hypothetical protein [Sedimentisphaerales bacterium]
MTEYLREDLLLYYSFDEPFHANVTDLSGNSRHGKVHGVEYRPEGKSGAAGFFPGTDGFVSVENVHLETFTFAAWIKTATGGVNNRRVFLFDSGAESFFAVQGATGGDVEFNTVIWQEDENEWEDDGIETDEMSLQENDWTHIAATFDGTRGGIYFDGRLIQMKELPRDGFTGTLYIGGIATHRGEFWHGMIDEVAVFKRALFAAEIKHLYDPAEDNPVLELKAYCERKKEWSPELAALLQRVAAAIRMNDAVDPNLLSGRGVAHFHEIRKESAEKDRWEEENEDRIIQFQFKGTSSRSDVFSGPSGKVKQLEWIFAENPEYGIRYHGDDLEIEDNEIGIFHRELGYDMHPDTFNRFHGVEPAEFLRAYAGWAQETRLFPSVTVTDDAILQLTCIHAAAGEKDTLEVRMNMGPPARILSLVETEDEHDERRTESSRQYRIHWQWHGNQCFVKDVERTEEETEFDDDDNPKRPRHRYARQKLEVLAYESRAAVPDRAFTAFGLPLESDTDVYDSVNQSRYSLDDVLSGRVKPGPRYRSRLGAKLPGLNMLLDDADALIRDKAVLVCFFDMQQRPSRYCVRALAKRAEELNGKGIAVVIVQASKINEDKLNEWAGSYDIPFPTGVIQGDVEETRFTWGVQSLPWLILTDKDHIVRAEGFRLDELAGILARIVESQK